MVVDGHASDVSAPASSATEPDPPISSEVAIAEQSVEEPKEPESMSSEKVIAEQPGEEPREPESVVQTFAGGSAAPLLESVLLSPAFRSAAAMAGWDAEALLQAALHQSPLPTQGSYDCTVQSDAGTSCFARKRDKHTPLSSARRHRRGRWDSINGTPLGRVPMKPLTLLSDDEVDSKTTNEQNDIRAHAGVEQKDNSDAKPTVSIKGDGSKGKEKENSPSKPPCLDQLREELSCAVCLDICFEPSTISCGHSFCGTCLQSVLQNCGHRCPKCRQSLRSETLKNCNTNTVLWNTIQILFPKESAARIQDQQRQRAELASQKPLKDESRHQRILGTRPCRLQPWRRSTLSDNTGSVDNFRSSFQTAAEYMASTERCEIGDHRQPTPLPWVSSSRSVWVASRMQFAARRPVSQTPEASQPAQSRTRRQIRATQEQIDAALAARLQQAELNAVSDVEEVIIVEGSSRSSSRSRRAESPVHMRLSHDSSSAANPLSAPSRALRRGKLRS